MLPVCVCWVGCCKYIQHPAPMHTHTDVHIALLPFVLSITVVYLHTPSLVSLSPEHSGRGARGEAERRGRGRGGGREEGEGRNPSRLALPLPPPPPLLPPQTRLASASTAPQGPAGRGGGRGEEKKRKERGGEKEGRREGREVRCSLPLSLPLPPSLPTPLLPSLSLSLLLPPCLAPSSLPSPSASQSLPLHTLASSRIRPLLLPSLSLSNPPAPRYNRQTPQQRPLDAAVHDERDSAAPGQEEEEEGGGTPHPSIHPAQSRPESQTRPLRPLGCSVPLFPSLWPSPAWEERVRERGEKRPRTRCCPIPSISPLCVPLLFVGCPIYLSISLYIPSLVSRCPSLSVLPC